MFGRATITLGIGLHSSFTIYFYSLYTVLFLFAFACSFTFACCTRNGAPCTILLVKVFYA